MQQMRLVILGLVGFSLGGFAGTTSLKVGTILSTKPHAEISCSDNIKIRSVAVKYLTLGLDGLLTQASGLVAYPISSEKKKLSLVGYLHGTVVDADNVPSKKKGNVDFAICAHGPDAVFAAPDYLGLGSSSGFHPYLHSKSEASVSLDLLRVAKQLFTQWNLEWNGKLFLTGYSQGGHSAMALLQQISKGDTEFTVTATAALSGPYDLSDTTIRATLTDPAPYDASVYTAYVLSSYSVLYPDVKIKEIVLPGFQRYLRLFPLHDLEGIQAITPASPLSLFAPETVKAILGNENHPVILALKENNVYDFKPQGPVFLCYGGSDKVVAPANALKAEKALTAHGATVKVMNAGAALTHATAAAPCTLGARDFFSQF